MTKKRLKLKLTDEQKKKIKKEFGNEIDELVLSEEEFEIDGSKENVMKVLKIENVATVSINGTGDIVN